MTRTRGARRGFAVTTALFMVAIVGVAMAAVGALMAADVGRTMNGSIDAQLRQLLIAAEIDTPAHLSDPTQRAWDTPLPSAIGEARVKTSRVFGGGGGDLIVSASVANRAGIETLRFEHSGGGWRLAGAEILDIRGQP